MIPVTSVTQNGWLTENPMDMDDFRGTPIPSHPIHMSVCMEHLSVQCITICNVNMHVRMYACIMYI